MSQSGSEKFSITEWLEPSIRSAISTTAAEFEAQDEELIGLIEEAGALAPELAIRLDNVVLARLVASVELAYRRGFNDAMKIKVALDFEL